MQAYDIPLHDIKPIMEVDEYSLYYLLGTIAIGALLLVLVIYGIYYLYKKSKTINIRKQNFQKLEALDLSDTKNTAYALSMYGATFKDDSPRHQEMYENLTQRLSAYKYKKSVKEFDSETLGYIEIYKEMLDV